jgi:hypothetical protein
MNREIKFRAWDEDRKVMVLDFSKEITYEIIFSSDDGNMFCGNFMDNGDWQEPKLMQYTGLKDKNGVEIYEGDFIGKKGAYIIWSERLSCWCFKFHNDEIETPLYHDDISKYEVIGNIYENPELLK